MDQKIRELIFVYNADSGLGNALLDSAHKIFSPATYNCNLCALTYGIAGERSAWKRFRRECRVPMAFLHKDEFKKAYASKFSAGYDFPIVLADTGGALVVFISPSVLKAMKGPEALIETIQSQLV